jgi:hypothetical protein
MINYAMQNIPNMHEDLGTKILGMVRLHLY